MNTPTHDHRKRRDLYISWILEVMLIAAVLPALLDGVPALTHLSI